MSMPTDDGKQCYGSLLERSRSLPSNDTNICVCLLYASDIVEKRAFCVLVNVSSDNKIQIITFQFRFIGKNVPCFILFSMRF